MHIYTTINEDTTSYLTVKFYDKSGALAAPASATWQCHDVRTGTVLQSSADITPIADTVEITIPSTVNKIVNAGLDEELHRITVIGVYGATDHVAGQYDFLVKNLSAIVS